MTFQGHNLNAPRWGKPYGHNLGDTEPMSDVVWCDISDPETNVKGQIGHPFSSKDVNAQHFEQTSTIRVETGNSYGTPTYQDRQKVTESMDICGYHWGKQNPFQAPETDTIKALETENDQWQAGYEAGEQHARYQASHTQTQ